MLPIPRFLLPFLLLALVCFNAAGQSKSLNVTYIANEGFLLRSDHHKVLIDALFDESYGAFAVPDKAVLQNIQQSVAPFDSIDALFLTHYHKDHCNPVLINQYLDKHPATPLVTSKPSLVFIDGDCFGFVTKQTQFREMTPAANQSVNKTVAGMQVTAYGLKHLTYLRNGIDLEQYMFNISFLIDMDGVKIFHSGDIMPEAFSRYLALHKGWNLHTDVAFLYYKMLEADPKELKQVLDVLRPRYIVPMHIPPTEIAQWQAKLSELKKQFPGIIFFAQPMEKETLTIPSNK
ncbi:MBL fold metallo-hydrolase [Paludibacter sp.]|uniref:MBL fold metallo-hydrolase n=1 Tax=Paludibacter sp. TaxID=1898105 RepID=UPI0013546230|nr:MBL fold metallo-hydrolase [Paludibacter sp.]MTK54027.1 MBL fold metallo-hydrolase [Paludibacter sp.]